MPQLSLYIDKETLNIVEKMAKINKTSISKWVCGQIKSSSQAHWPQGYFKNFGALAGDELPPINDLKFSDDTKRDSF